MRLLNSTTLAFHEFEGLTTQALLYCRTGENMNDVEPIPRRRLR